MRVSSWWAVAVGIPRVSQEEEVRQGRSRQKMTNDSYLASDFIQNLVITADEANPPAYMYDNFLRKRL